MKFGHVRRDCEEYARVKGEEYAKFKGQARSVPDKKAKTGACEVTITAQDDKTSENESAGLIVQHALSVESVTNDQWILVSGATCHMCNNKDLFINLRTLQTPLNVTLGDGHNLQAVRRGDVALIMKLPNGKPESVLMFY